MSTTDYHNSKFYRSSLFGATLLEVSDEHNNTLFIQLSRDGKCWNVNSAGIFKKKYSRNKQEVYTRPALEPGTGTDSSEVNRGQTEGATATSRNDNSSQTSVGKDTKISETDKEKVASAIESAPSEDTEEARQSDERTDTQNDEQIDLSDTFASTLSVYKFLKKIGYKGQFQIKIGNNGGVYAEYDAAEGVKEKAYPFVTAPKHIFRVFYNYGNVMGVKIPADLKAEFEKADGIKKQKVKRSSGGAPR